MKRDHLKLVHKKAKETIFATYNLSGDGGDGMNLEQRVDNLDKDVRDLRLDVAEIKGQLPHLATKAELSTATTKIILWIVSTAIALGAFNWFTNSFPHNHSSSSTILQQDKK